MKWKYLKLVLFVPLYVYYLWLEYSGGFLLHYHAVALISCIISSEMLQRWVTQVFYPNHPDWEPNWCSACHKYSWWDMMGNKEGVSRQNNLRVMYLAKRHLSGGCGHGSAVCYFCNLHFPNGLGSKQQPFSFKSESLTSKPQLPETIARGVVGQNTIQ